MKRKTIFGILGVLFGMTLSIGGALIAKNHTERQEMKTASAATLDDVGVSNRMFAYRPSSSGDPANNTSYEVGSGAHTNTSTHATTSVAADGQYQEGSNYYPAYLFTYQETGTSQDFLYATARIRIVVTVQPWEHCRVRVLFNPVKSVMTGGGNADHAIEMAWDDTPRGMYTASAYEFTNFLYKRDDYSTKSTGDDVIQRAGRNAAGEAATAFEKSWYLDNKSQVEQTYWLQFAVSGYVESTSKDAHSLTQSVRFGINIRESSQYACKVNNNSNETYYDTIKDAITYTNTLPTGGSGYSITMLRDHTEPAANYNIIVTNSLYFNLAGFNLTSASSGRNTFFLARQANGLTTNINIHLRNTGSSQNYISGAFTDSVFLLGDTTDTYTVTLYVNEKVLVHNTLDSGRAVAVHKSGILYIEQNGEVKSNSTVCGVVVGGGKLYLSGKLTVPNGDSIYTDKENNVTPSVYLYYSPTITHGSNKHTFSVASGGPSTLNLYGDNGLASSYLTNSCSAISINYATKPTANNILIASSINSLAVANKFSVAGLASNLMLYYNSTTKELRTAITYSVTFDANGGTGTQNGKTVKQGDTYMLPDCTFTAPLYYHFDCWGTDATGTTTYQAGASVTINSNRVFYAIWAQSSSDKITQFIDVYMHMSANTSGQCNTYFEPAKNAFNALDSEARAFFFSSSTSSVVAAKNRLNAWAAYKGYAVNGENQYVVLAQNSNVLYAANDNQSIIIAVTVLSMAALVSTLGFFLLKKKKHN